MPDSQPAGIRRLRQTHRRDEPFLQLLGEIASHGDRPDVDAADAHFQQALARATELEMRPLVAHCHLGLGQLYRRTGDSAKADVHLGTAAQTYRELDMRFWLEKAEAGLRPSLGSSH